jgi:hypothetical protein
MHEDSLTLIRYHQVRLSWQIAKTAPIMDAHSPHNAPDGHFWLRATGANPAHYVAALGRVERVHICFA